MAIYRLSVQTIQRGQGRSVVAAAAYRSGAALADERLGIDYDFRRKAGVEHAEIMGPANTPAALLEREALWNAAERSDRRKDAVPAREILVSLPYELTAEQRRELVREFVSESLVKRGMIADFAIHQPDKEGDQRNFHAHILLTTREVGPQGFGPKNPDWNLPTFVTDARYEWARMQNKHLELALGPKAPKVSEKSLADRGVDRRPSEKMGPAATAMERRQEPTERGAIRNHSKALKDRTDANSVRFGQDWKPSNAPQIVRPVDEIKAELRHIHERLVASRDGFKSQREAIHVPRPPSIKSLEFEATKGAVGERKRAERRLRWEEKRAQERGVRPADLRRLMAWITNPLGALTSSLKRANADLARVAAARRHLLKADKDLVRQRAWVESQTGRAWIANRREPAIQMSIVAHKERRTLERKIKRFDVRISQSGDALKRLDLAIALNIKGIKFPEKLPTKETGEAFASRYTSAVNRPVLAAINTFPKPTIAAAFIRMTTPTAAPTLASSPRSRAPVQAREPEIDFDIDF